MDATDGVEWCRLGSDGKQSPMPLTSGGGCIPLWVCAAPIWVLPELFPLLESQGVKRIVALSSTSRFTKDESSDIGEQEVSRRLAGAEDALQEWAEQRDVAWVVLRPTLIYGLGRDKNIAEMARFIRCFGFFPVLGKSQGLRQPVHVDDVAEVCVAAIMKHEISNRAYNISGGETIPYREMVARVFNNMRRPARLLPVPLWMFQAGMAVLKLVPGFRHWSAAMAERMNRDLVFDHSEAARDLDFNPRRFTLSAKDILE
jgi:nucleoside-diphosphate-sugar epimerase